jgi:hypothetical protein
MNISKITFLESLLFHTMVSGRQPENVTLLSLIWRWVVTYTWRTLGHETTYESSPDSARMSPSCWAAWVWPWLSDSGPHWFLAEGGEARGAGQATVLGVLPLNFCKSVNIVIHDGKFYVWLCRLRVCH